MKIHLALAVTPAMIFAISSHAYAWSSSDFLTDLDLAQTRAEMAIYSDPQIKALLNSSQDHQFTALEKVNSGLLQTTKFQHYYRGLEVVGSLSFHEVGLNGRQVHNQIASFDLDTAPTLSSGEASALARSASGDDDLLTTPELKILPSSDRTSAKLVYWIKLQPTEVNPGHLVVLDAQTGEILVNIENRPFANIQVVSAKDKGYAIDTTKITNPSLVPAAHQNDCEIYDDKSGSPLAFSPHNCTPMVINSHGVTGMDDSSIRAANNALNVFTYYFEVFNRNSYDGKGSDIVSVVHAGNKWAIALWNPAQQLMAYGDGDGVTTRDFTYALDIAGHEVTHGVVESTPSPLLYFGESGAVNEANSDFFGVMINGQKSWVFGKDAFIKGTGYRDLANPHNLSANITFDPKVGPKKTPYPATYKELLPKQQTCDSGNDNCWAHLNSTVTSHARYLVTQSIGADNAQKLYYTVMTQALNSGTTVLSEAQDTLRVCKQMFGPTSDLCTRVMAAYTAVGITGL